MFASRTAQGAILAAALAVGGAAFAADTKPAAPAAPAVAPAPTPTPTAAAVATAGEILGDIGIKQSIALIVPGMLTELERNVTVTRPEIKDSLRETLRAIQPDFDNSAKTMYDQAATILAGQMSEKDLKEVAAFFASPAGKAYLAAEPVFLQNFSSVFEPWRQQLSTDIMTRARQEMKKKGIEF